MATAPPLNIVRLDDTHLVDDFGCGKSKLNSSIKRFAREHANLGFSVTWVATSGTDVAGYVTVSASAVPVEDFPAEMVEGLGIPAKFAAPTLHIGRVAVANGHRGTGLGPKLMWHAFDIAIDAHSSLGLGVYGVDLFIEDLDLLEKFYKQFDFFAIDPEGKHLFVHLETLRQAKGL